ncbi:MAG: porin family protein [Cyclobacteriaceae bacterium]|nr:porin family protein [Cyclobacteriaceae bacterium]
MKLQVVNNVCSISQTPALSGLLCSIILLVALLAFINQASAQQPSNIISGYDSLIDTKLKAFDSLQVSSSRQFNALKDEYDSFNNHLNSATAKLQHQMDSLQGLGESWQPYQSKLDSLRSVHERKLSNLVNRADSLRSNVIQHIEDLKLPGELSSLAVPFTQTLNEFDITLPDASFNFTLPDEIKIPSFRVNELSNSLPGIQDKNLPGVSSEWKSRIGDLSQVNGVATDLPSTEQILKAVEGKASEEFIEQIGALPEMPSIPSTEQETKAMMLDQGKNELVNHFAEQQEVLQEAMNQISSLKRKYSSVQSIYQINKRSRNAMHDRPFVERLVPGLSIQFQQRNEYWVDLNPYLGYRFNGRLTAGLGWNYRIAYNFDARQINKASTVYGIRLYGEYEIKQGIKPRLEIESMNTPVRTLPDQKYNHREWVFSAMVGLKKEYRISKQVLGNAQVLYNLYNPDYKSPYVDRWNLRMGFEMHLKRKAHPN